MNFVEKTRTKIDNRKFRRP